MLCGRAGRGFQYPGWFCVNTQGTTSRGVGGSASANIKGAGVGSGALLVRTPVDTKDSVSEGQDGLEVP